MKIIASYLPGILPTRSVHIATYAILSVGVETNNLRKDICVAR